MTTTTQPAAPLTIEVKPHPTSADHRIAVVTTSRGRTFACTYAVGDDGLCVEKVAADWKADRRAFRPYDTTAERYL